MKDMMTQAMVRDTIRHLLLRSEDYRVGIIGVLNARFLDFAIDFFKKVAEAKMRGQTVDADWYRGAFMDDSLNKADIAISAGINIKTINNIYSTVRKNVVIDAAAKSYASIKRLIDGLADEGDVDISITIKFNGVSVDLNLTESLLVVNALAVKRLAMQGGAWSQIGKRVEKPLMLTLCYLYSVTPENYSAKLRKKAIYTGEFNLDERETDFFLVDERKRHHKCEVKLIGKGNPENTDRVFAKKDKVFVADTLSGMNIRQLDANRIYFVDLRSEEGFQGFEKALRGLNIPCRPISGNVEAAIDKAIAKALKQNSLPG